MPTAPTHSTAVPPRPSPTYSGRVTYEDGATAGLVLIALTNLATGARDAVIPTDADGHFEVAVAPGDYAVAIATTNGFAYLEQQAVPSTTNLTLTRDCSTVSGGVTPSLHGTQVEFYRLSSHKGDAFLVGAREDGGFETCIPPGNYVVRLFGTARSQAMMVQVPIVARLSIAGVLAADVLQEPRILRPLTSNANDIVAEIVQRNARLIGLGEATHGTAELVSARGEFVIELIRQAQLRAIFLENDAIAVMQLDDYIQGKDVDVDQAVSSLGFWITDTYEFLRFLADLRAANASSRDPVHIWGVDVQNVELPVQLLLANADRLKISKTDQATLGRVGHDRGRPVKELLPAHRRSLDQLLARLSKRRTANQLDLRTAIAARSMVVQLRYWEGDERGQYGTRRDAGMAALTQFIMAQTKPTRAVVWAHNSHVGRSPDGAKVTLGRHLANTGLGYYVVGFFVYKGSARAWDAAGKIGVIPNALPPAATHSLEGAVMAAAGAPDIAWTTLTQLAASLGDWLNVPHYVRSFGAVYSGEEDSMSLELLPSTFDAAVVIKSGHDSTPTPAGVQRAKR